MKLAEFSVKNSLLVNMLSVFVIVAGLFSVINMQREAFPNVAFDVVMVTTVYGGATASEIEKLITTPIEKELRGVSGVDEIISTSDEGISSITVKLDADATDKGRVVNDIQRAVDMVSDLPDGAEDPIVVEIQMKEYPIIEVSLSGDMSEDKLQKYAEALQDQLEELDGVAKIERKGYRDRQIWIEVDPDTLRHYYVSIEDIMQALKRHNVNVPGGKIKTEGEEYNIRTNTEFYTIPEIEDIIIRANDAGNILRIKDIAHVKDAFEDEDIMVNTNGTRAIDLIVLKRESADAIDTVAEIKSTIDDFKESIDDELGVSYIRDMSYYIQRRLNVLKNNGMVGFFMVLVCLFVFLHPILSIFTALGIPIAFLATFAMMSYFNLNINLMTMFGLIMVLGMMVDDSIIISENIYRYIEEGMDPKDAAIKGAGEVMLPVFATILTTIAAFSPLIFMSGLMGKFVRAIPQVVILALVASLIEAFIILPSHLADFSRPAKKDPKTGEVIHKKKWFKALVNVYSRILKGALRKKYFVILIAFLIFAASLYIAVKYVPIKMFTGRGVEQFMIKAEAPIGVSLDKMRELMRPVERVVETISPSELDAYVTEVGAIVEERGYDPNAQRGSHYAQIMVYLTALQNRERSAEEVANSIRPALDKIKGFEKLGISTFHEGPPSGKPVDIKVRGDDYKILEKISDKMKEQLTKVEGVSDISDNYEFGKKEVHIAIDHDMAKEAGLSASLIAASVRNAFKGGVATSIRLPKAEEEIDVLVRFDEQQRNKIDIFDKLFIPNPSGKLIPLKKVAKVEFKKGISSIRHLDGKRAVSVTAEIDNKKTSSFKINTLLSKKFKAIKKEYLGYTLKYGGEHEQTVESISSLLKAFLLAFFLIFIILTAQFRSLVQPFVVMLTIPLGIIGVILAFFLHNEPFSFLALLGVIGLMGVVVNDSIVFMDFINKLRREGLDRKTSIIEAGKLRLRPILLTTITTVSGLMPVAYGIGGFDPFVRPAALAIAWGLLFASILTLIIIPCVYTIIDDIAIKIAHHPSVRLKCDENS